MRQPYLFVKVNSWLACYGWTGNIHRMRLYFTWILMFTLLSGAVSAQTDTFAMRRALQRYTDAYGGGRDADALSSISIEGTQELNGQVYDFLLRKKRPDSIRYRLSHGETHIVSAFDGITGWIQVDQVGEETTRELTRDELRALKEEADFETPLFRYLERRGNQIEMTGREQIEGRDAYVFEVTESDGRRSRYYMDAREPHILQKERLGAEGEVVLTIVYRDYREVEGFPFAYQIETKQGEQMVSLVKVDTIVVNPGLLSFYFKMPQ